MNDLLKTTVDAHGGLETWNKFRKISARIVCGGVTWAMKQQPGIMDDLYVTSDTRREFTSHYPFINSDWHTSFEPGRVAIENSRGEVVEELLDPRSSFTGHTVETPWTRLQLAYFAGYAMWTYFNAPFNFAGDNYEAKELVPWKDGQETFRRLRVTFPKEIASHGAVQTFYIDDAGLIRRHDYDVDILGGSGAAHFLSNYVDVQGIKVATKRSVYVRQEDNSPLVPEPLLVSVDLREITLE
ncbi:hypothetical protein [Chitinophaga varians]|uniref:hypothetical protein n=1 Tax=Chitinophaga varians TaxID=2202339 RepID=UPI00165ECE85|nr:hypothetical protein [Chitinophaga varians]MBC9914538.1 hypothetical protein [Chitinophaga varians]